MRHFTCEVTKTGDYIIKNLAGDVIERGTCKEDAKGDKVTVNPNFAWAALIRAFEVRS